MKKDSYIFDNCGLWNKDMNNAVTIMYNNDIKDKPQVIVLNDDVVLGEILRRNCRHHKFTALDNNNIICERFNENYTLDVLDENYYGYADNKYIILHIINTHPDIKEFVDRFNETLSFRLISEIKQKRKQLCNLKKAYC